MSKTIHDSKRCIREIIYETDAELIQNRLK